MDSAWIWASSAQKSASMESLVVWVTPQMVYTTFIGCAVIDVS